MTKSERGRLAVAGILAAAALGSAAPAQADKADRCEAQARAHRAPLPPDRGAPRLGGRQQVVERPRLAQVLRALREAVAMAITDIDEQKLEAVHRPRRDRGRRRAQRGARDPRRRARPLPRDGRRPARHAAGARRRAPARRSATSASGSTPRPRAATSIYDATARYVLPPEHALVLADETSPFSMHGTFQSANAAVAIRERLVERFINGDGVGWHEHHHDLWHGTERAFATAYRTHLLAEWLPALDGVVAKLEAGALVADVGCGHGASTILMARGVPGLALRRDRLPRRLDRHRAQARRRGGRRRPRALRGRRRRATSRARATTSSRSSTRSTTSATRSPPRATRRRRSPPAAR